MTFFELVEQVSELLRRHGRITYRALKRQFELDDDYLEDLKNEMIEARQLAMDEQGRLLVWAGEQAARLRGAITPTPRQQGVEGDDATPGSPRWRGARLLKRVCALALASCPFCRQGARRSIAAITQAEVIRKILHHLKRAADPPPIAPARSRQEAFDWVA